MGTEIFSYIPQRPPFMMIGALISADELHTKTTFTILPDNLFVNNNFFSESGMIENMAQTAGAGVGYRRQQAGLSGQSGYIAALKHVTIHRQPKVNDTITTYVTFEQILLNFHIVKGKVMLGEDEIASCEFKIFVNN